MKSKRLNSINPVQLIAFFKTSLAMKHTSLSLKFGFPKMHREEKNLSYTIKNESEPYSLFMLCSQSFSLKATFMKNSTSV